MSEIIPHDCKICGRELKRRRYESGQLEARAQYNRRKTCFNPICQEKARSFVWRHKSNVYRDMAERTSLNHQKKLKRESAFASWLKNRSAQ